MTGVIITNNNGDLRTKEHTEESARAVAIDVIQTAAGIKPAKPAKKAKKRKKQ